jgi:hypothetical protein
MTKLAHEGHKRITSVFYLDISTAQVKILLRGIEIEEFFIALLQTS